MMMRNCLKLLEDLDMVEKRIIFFEGILRDLGHELTEEEIIQLIYSQKKKK